jgi:hypothetical protein
MKPPERPPPKKLRPAFGTNGRETDRAQPNKFTGHVQGKSKARPRIDALKMCKSKRAFVSREAAEAHGQHGYPCPVCHLYHASGPVVSTISNPVLPATFQLQ